MSACLRRLTLILPKVSEQEGETLRGRKGGSCLHTQPTDVVELLSSLGCPLVSLRDAWWQRWSSKSFCGLRGARVNVPKGTVPWPCQARTLCHCPRCLLCQHALCPRTLQRRHMGGCQASASITISGSSLQRLPTVTAHIAVVIVSMHHYMPAILMTFVGDALIAEFLYH